MPRLLPVHSCVTSGGQVTTGGVSSTRVSWLVHEPVLEFPSVAVHVADVDPGAVSDIVPGAHFAGMVPSHRSEAVAVTVSVAEHVPPCDDVVVVCDGVVHVTTGGVVSTTVTFVLQV